MSSPKVALVNQFIDEPYHRTSYTLASPVASEVSRAASAACLTLPFHPLALRPVANMMTQLPPAQIERVASLITKAAIQAVDLREHQVMLHCQNNCLKNT